MPFPVIVLGAGLIGFLGGRYAPQFFQAGGGHQAADKSYGPSVIDDETPTPGHAQFGWDGTLTQVGWFFTKAALPTFCGAYTVLSYFLWPEGFAGPLDWPSAIAAGAAVALSGLKLSVTKTLGLSALAGLGFQLLG